MLKRLENPPNPFVNYSYEWLDVPPEVRLEIFEERSKSVLSTNDSPDIGFRYSVNPYRGCFHACAYCFARPTHQYLDFGAGSDFERKIVVKVNAPQLLEKEFWKPAWTGETIVFSGVTDCYQPLEGSYELTRGCLDVCARFSNPVSIITKGALVTRDIDLLLKIQERSRVRAYISIPFADDELSKKIEPGAPRSSRRFRALKELSDAGIKTGVGIAPLIPGLNDTQIPEILERAKDAGASTAFITLLRLPAEVREVFLTRLAEACPSRYDKINNAIQELRGGKYNNSEWGNRMRGEGERWKAIEWLFDQTCQRLGLNRREPEATVPGFRRPREQLSLFG